MTKRNMKKQHRKVTLEEWAFRRTQVGTGRHSLDAIRDIPNEFIHKYLSWFELLPSKSVAIKTFEYTYKKIRRERCIRKRLGSYAIKVQVYLRHPRNLNGRKVCRPTM